MHVVKEEPQFKQEPEVRTSNDRPLQRTNAMSSSSKESEPSRERKASLSSNRGDFSNGDHSKTTSSSSFSNSNDGSGVSKKKTDSDSQTRQKRDSERRKEADLSNSYNQGMKKDMASPNDSIAYSGDCANERDAELSSENRMKSAAGANDLHESEPTQAEGNDKNCRGKDNNSNNNNNYNYEVLCRNEKGKL